MVREALEVTPVAARKPKDWLNLAEQDAADVPAAAAALSESEPQTASNLPAWSDELVRAKQHASAALQQVEEWHTRVGKLTSQLAAVRAEQAAALEDRETDSSERVERIATAQIREKVIAADIEHERASRERLIHILRDALKHLGQPVQLAYLRERERRVAAATLWPV